MREEEDLRGALSKPLPLSQKKSPFHRDGTRVCLIPSLPGVTQNKSAPLPTHQLLQG